MVRESVLTTACLHPGVKAAGSREMCVPESHGVWSAVQMMEQEGAVVAKQEERKHNLQSLHRISVAGFVVRGGAGRRAVCRLDVQTAAPFLYVSSCAVYQRSQNAHTLTASHRQALSLQTLNTHRTSATSGPMADKHRRTIANV